MGRKIDPKVLWPLTFPRMPLSSAFKTISGSNRKCGLSGLSAYADEDVTYLLCTCFESHWPAHQSSVLMGHTNIPWEQHSKKWQTSMLHLSPFLPCKHHCPIRLHFQTSSAIKLVRISRPRSQSIKPNMGPFWLQGPVWLVISQVISPWSQPYFQPFQRSSWSSWCKMKNSHACFFSLENHHSSNL